MVEYYLGDVLAETGRLALAGTGSMNIRLNHRFHSHQKVKQLPVQLACGDSGTVIGAAAFAVNQAGIPIKPRRDLYLGPSFHG